MKLLVEILQSDPRLEAIDLKQHTDFLVDLSLNKFKPDTIDHGKELTALAFNEYKNIFQATQLKERLSAHYAHFNALVSEIDPKTEAANAAQDLFQNQVQSLVNERHQVNTLLSRHSQIMELLEIPQLIDTFIRNGYYEEAMDLKTHVQRLLIRYPNISILKKISAQVSRAISLMLNQLTLLLSGDVKLPLCMRVIGYLRRMEAYAEPELRTIFLKQRYSFLSKLILNLKASDPDPYDYLRKYIEVNRQHFFDLVTHYRAIFSESSQIYVSTVVSKEFISTASIGACTLLILSSFVTHTIDQMVQVLSEQVPLLTDTTQIDTIATKTMYFGTSCSRIGIDFRGRVKGIFEDALCSLVCGIMAQGVQSFVSSCDTRRIQSNALGGFVESSAPGTISCPAECTEFPSLARLVNEFFVALNALRVMPVFSVSKKIGKEAQDGLRVCAEFLERNAVPGDASFNKACWVFGEKVVPAIANGLSLIYEGRDVGIDIKSTCKPIAAFVGTVVVQELDKAAVGSPGKGQTDALAVESSAKQTSPSEAKSVFDSHATSEEIQVVEPTRKAELIANEATKVMEERVDIHEETALDTEKSKDVEDSQDVFYSSENVSREL